MAHPRRRLAALLAPVALLALPVGGTPALADEAPGPHNVVDVLVTRDGQRQARASVAVVVETDGVVDNQNLAYATSQGCAGCESAAVAFQAVLVVGPVATVTPVNVGAAANVECTGCRAFAYAYQYVLTVPAGVDLDDDADAELEGIEAAARGIAGSRASEPLKDALLDGLKARFKAVIDRELVQTGQASPVGEAEDVDGGDD